MKKISLCIILLFISVFVHPEELYIKTFGKKTDQAMIFLHGGPGYNCVSFEVTVAKKLADKGFFVIVYDRRGEGRSSGLKAAYTLKESFSDLDLIYKKYNLTKASLIGHSFGGIIGTLFTEAEPEKVESLILVCAPVSLQTSFKYIIKRSRELYLEKNDKASLSSIAMLEKMDTTALMYSSYCFVHAMQSGAYKPKNPTEEARAIYTTFKTDKLLLKYASNMTQEALQGFFDNEKYTTMDLSTNLKKMKENGTKIYALYGKEDGLYSPEQISDLQQIIGESNLKYFDDCSHNVFIDQQNLFIQALTDWK